MIVGTMLKHLKKLGHIARFNVSRWSALEKTFNSRPNTNLTPITNETVGLFGVVELTSVHGFSSITAKCVTRTDELVNEALSADRQRKMVEIFDELSDSLCQVADLAEFIRFAHPSPDYSRAAESASVAISGIVEKLNTNIKLYEVLKRTISHGDIVPNTEEDRFVEKLFRFDFEQSGIHLSDQHRNRVVELNNLILYLGQNFVSGVANPKVIKRTSLPESIRDVFTSDRDRVIISGLYADSPNPLVREMAYKIFLHPDPHQDRLLAHLLEARFELAQTCGFITYSERALRGSILETPTNVLKLLTSLRDQIGDKAEIDFGDMGKLKSIESPHSGRLAVWDVPYFSQKVKKDMFDVSAKEYSPYFSLGACMEGLNIIFQSLYGISLIITDLVAGETWSKDVYKLGVHHEVDGLLGYIYCDFYERNDKPNQDCHFTIRGGKVLTDGTYQLPIVVLMLNFSLPRWSNPTLLTPSMVDNLFHEMGHAMHSMLARTRYQHVSGTRCSTDFAEVPSILMEYFASDCRVLSLFAKHFQTNEPMPEMMLHKLCASKRLFTASETQLQIFYAALDQIYHGTHPLAGTTTDVLANVQKHFYGLPYIDNTTWQLRFSHLVGYGAKYYSYLVSRAIAHLIWQTYFKRDPLSRTQGEKYRNECLQFGGSKHPLNLVGDFLGFVPNSDVLAQSIVDEIDDHQRQVQDIVRKLAIK